MGNPYVGEIRMFGGNFAPLGWMFCDGALISIPENEVLFNLIGTTYGGDGQSTFGLPDLRGRLPLHMGTGSGITYVIGQSAGVETVTLSTTQIPAHNHMMLATSTGLQTSPSGAYPGAASNSAGLTLRTYTTTVPTTSLGPNAIGNSGSNQPHTNMQPFLGINFIISLYGVYPQQG